MVWFPSVVNFIDVESLDEQGAALDDSSRSRLGGTANRRQEIVSDALGDLGNNVEVGPSWSGGETDGVNGEDGSVGSGDCELSGSGSLEVTTILEVVGLTNGSLTSVDEESILYGAILDNIVCVDLDGDRGGNGGLNGSGSGTPVMVADFDLEGTLVVLEHQSVSNRLAIERFAVIAGEMWVSPERASDGWFICGGASLRYLRFGFWNLGFRFGYFRFGFWYLGFGFGNLRLWLGFWYLGFRFGNLRFGFRVGLRFLSATLYDLPRASTAMLELLTEAFELARVCESVPVVGANWSVSCGA